MRGGWLIPFFEKRIARIQEREFTVLHEFADFGSDSGGTLDISAPTPMPRRIFFGLLTAAYKSFSV